MSLELHLCPEVEVSRLGWEAGEVIFKSWEPWVSVLCQDQANTRCPCCYRAGHRPSPDITCQSCELVSYCSWGCRAKDDPHRLECPYLARAGHLPDRDEIRVMMRAILKLRGPQVDLLAGGGEGDEVPGHEDRRRFSSLLSHSIDFMEDTERRENIHFLYTQVETFLEDDMPDFATFLEVLGRLYINGFEICTEKMETYGWGVYLGPSILDHSCQPTASVSFSGRQLTVTANRSLANLGEAFISYCDTALPSSVRREKLLRNYFFLCACSKCKHSAHVSEAGGHVRSEQSREVRGRHKRQRGRR